MLNVLRHKGVAKKVLWVVTVIIILSFAIFGTAYRMDNQINSAGTMYGKGVNYRDFQESYFDARDQAIMLYGEEFFKNGQNLDLEQQTWDRLVLLKEARKQNIKVKDQDVVNFIAQVPFFQREGKFDAFVYKMIVTNKSVFDRRSTRDFEEGVRRNLMIRQLLEQVAGPITITDDELKKEYTLRNEKITLDYALIDPKPFAASIKATPQDAERFYNDHKQMFRQPALVKVDYVHLLVDEKATDAVKNEAKKQIYNLSAQLTASSDFATVAKSFKLDVKTSDYFSLEAPILTFASAPEETEKLFAMKAGEFTKPLNVPDGWQIIRINDKKESQIPSFNDIKDTVISAYVNEKAYEAANNKANELLPKLKTALSTGDFKKAASSVGLTANQTPSFSRGEYIANVGLVREFQEEARKLTTKSPLSGIVLTSQGPAIIHLAKTEGIDEKEFTNGKEEFRQMLEARTRQQKIGMFVTQLRLAANVKSKIKRR